MTHRYSKNGVVGLGALGSAIESLLPHNPSQTPGAILFCVKAYDLETALLEHHKIWPITLPFITLCNGYIWPEIERNLTIFASRPLRVGMTTIGSTIDAAGNLSIFKEHSRTAWGNWGNGEQSTCLASEFAYLNSHLPNASWHDDVRPLIRQKWIVNVVINSIAAAYRMRRNIQLRDRVTEVEDVLGESILLAEKLWPSLHPQLRTATLLQIIWEVVDGTANNENSMAKDVRLGRKNESSYLSGIAEKYDGFPKLKALTSLINH